MKVPEKDSSLSPHRDDEALKSTTCTYHCSTYLINSAAASNIFVSYTQTNLDKDGQASLHHALRSPRYFRGECRGVVDPGIHESHDQQPVRGVSDRRSRGPDDRRASCPCPGDRPADL